MAANRAALLASAAIGTNLMSRAGRKPEEVARLVDSLTAQVRECEGV